MHALARRALPALALALSLGAARAQDPCHTSAGGVEGRLGTVAFPNSGAAAAQPAFLRGVALLHSFEYVDAGEAFRAAQAADARFAMAFWLEALSYRHPLWGEEDAAAARATLRRLGASAAARLAAAGSARERAFGAAVEALYAEGDEGARAAAHAAAWRAAAAALPGDPEAEAFASIAVQGLAMQRPPEERDALLDEAAAFAGRVFAVNRDHPGAAHYLIHAFDTPARAARGVEAARVYAEIAPAAQHALHMPSHIFVQLGQWDAAAASNERSWAASRAWVARRGASPAELDFHSLTWLQYAYLQQGRLRAARALMDTVAVVLGGDDAGGYSDARYVATDLAFQYAAATGAWDGVPATALPPDDEPTPRARQHAGLHAYHVAAAAALRGDTSAAGARRLRAAADATPEGPPRLGAEIRALGLAALVALAAGDGERAVALLRDAAAMDARQAPTGPPYVLPAAELLGAVLLELGRPAEAAEAYAAALARRPGRTQALLGLARARAAAGETAAAADAYRLLLANWAGADADLPALAEARRGAGAP